ncbi:MAG: DUF2341 domain-containing protein [Candidatus Omnitrophica bacterium]|nr:DUF2341 domain-containing protein [Candidatus Omnitrophota bacterium]MBU4302791.1 DUF2341 domain-containing protein [Candidatus Omnitrophota bacterium]MBU4467718.1 DUF2341 domain-containing protein [Candidatus Omnitrophota bacterium]MCG2708631.1 DUF2341 domain-containing protein [Candidatus Omnitrophota bacterium]
MNRYIVVMMLGIAGLGLGVRADAEEIPTQKGPLVYEFNLQGPLTVESERMSTQGMIQEIAASWEFAGEVRLEVSANAGNAYTRITNGQILNEGFIPGNQLCFKADIPAGSMLKNVTLGYKDTSGVSAFLRNQELAAFKYHKTINISGSNEELFNYPVKIKIAKENVREDFKDVRFTASDGQTPLDYYLESRGGLNLPYSDDSADFWVKVPQIPAEGTKINVYYGNENAKDESSPEKVFAFYDDFNSAKLDETKWQLRSELDRVCNLKDGQLQLKGCSIISRNFKMRKGVLEFKAKAEKNAAIQAICRGVFSERSAYPFEQMVYSSAFAGAEHTIAVNDVAKLNIGNPIQPLTDYIYKVIVGTTGITFERYSDDYEKQAEIRFLDTYTLDDGYIGLKSSTAIFEAGSVYFDWIRVRPYVEVEPKAITRIEKEMNT